MEDWLQLLETSGFSKIKISEQVHPVSASPLSVIFECSC
jgi:hypothetical protein